MMIGIEAQNVAQRVATCAGHHHLAPAKKFGKSGFFSFGPTESSHLGDVVELRSFPDIVLQPAL